MHSRGHRAKTIVVRDVIGSGGGGEVEIVIAFGESFIELSVGFAWIFETRANQGPFFQVRAVSLSGESVVTKSDGGSLDRKVLTFLGVDRVGGVDKGIQMFKERKDGWDLREDQNIHVVGDEMITGCRAGLCGVGGVNFAIGGNLGERSADGFEQGEEGAGDGESLRRIVVQEPGQKFMGFRIQLLGIVSSAENLDEKDKTEVEAQDIGMVVGTVTLEVKIVNEERVDQVDNVEHHEGGRLVRGNLLAGSVENGRSKVRSEHVGGDGLGGGRGSVSDGLLHLGGGDRSSTRSRHVGDGGLGMIGLEAGEVLRTEFIEGIETGRLEEFFFETFGAEEGLGLFEGAGHVGREGLVGK